MMTIFLRIAGAFALLVGLLQACSAQTGPTNVIVSGHVYYANGSPVEGALVDFKCFCGVGGMLPPPTHTDKEGSFTLPYAALGEGWLTASKESEGLQDATNALYGPTSPSYVRVDLRAGASIRGMDLQFEVPRPLLRLRVVEKSTALPMPNASIFIAWPDDQNIKFLTTVENDGTFVLVLPKHPLSISVSAPGRKVWRYQDQKTGATFLDTSDLPVELTVELETSSLHSTDSPTPRI